MTTVRPAPVLWNLIQYAHSVCQAQGVLPRGLPSCLIQKRIASCIWTLSLSCVKAAFGQDASIVILVPQHQQVEGVVGQFPQKYQKLSLSRVQL